MTYDSYKIRPLTTLSIILFAMILLIISGIASFLVAKDWYSLGFMIVIISLAIYLIYDYYQSRHDHIMITGAGIQIRIKQQIQDILWGDIEYIAFCARPFDGLFLQIKYTGHRPPTEINFGRGTYWTANFYHLRRKIIHFSQRDDITILRSKQWYLKIV